MGGKSPAEVVGHMVVVLLAWAVVLMAASLAFTSAWNNGFASAFGLTRIGSLESLCMLSCVWIVSRIIVPKVTVESRA